MIKEKTIVVTLMRKGSKRLPGKNVSMFKGKPLYQHTVETAEKIGLPYYVLTDYERERIPLVYCKYIRVPDKFCEDFHISNEKIKWFLEQHEIECENIVLLQVTSPVRDYKHIMDCIDHFEKSDYDCGLYVKKIDAGFYYIDEIPLYNSTKRDYNGSTKKEIFKETGGFYIFKKYMLERNHITNGRCMYFRDPFGYDIDTKEDLKQCLQE